MRTGDGCGGGPVGVGLGAAVSGDPPADPRPAIDWPSRLAAPPEPGEGCACQWCAAAPPEPVEPLPADHRETD